MYKRSRLLLSSTISRALPGGLRPTPSSSSSSIAPDCQLQHLVTDPPAHSPPSLPRLQLPASNDHLQNTEPHPPSSERDQPLGPSLHWFQLPSVPPAAGLARALELKELTAVRWVTKCCPQLSRALIEKLFRLRGIRVLLPEAHQIKKPRLRRVSRKEQVFEGAILCLPKSVLLQEEDVEQDLETKCSKDGTKGTSGSAKHDASNEKRCEPTLKELEWIRNMVLHMDPHVIAINKPSGLAVQGGVGVKRNLDTLIGPALSFKNEEGPKLVHRLDKETSGVMVLGRTTESTAVLHAMFRAKTSSAISGCKDVVLGDNAIERKYWALVIGRPNQNKGCITAPLRKVVLDGGKSEAIVVARDNSAEDSQEAVTEYKVLGPSVHGCTWLELHPLTGRKHQLRVHCAEALGMPIVGDYKYGRRIHDSWLLRDAFEDEKKYSIREDEDGGSEDHKNFKYCSAKGSVVSKVPMLHLHSRLLTIPKLKEVSKKQVTQGTFKSKQAFMERLRLVAPLPPHMKSSWDLLPPSLKHGKTQ